MAPVCCAEAEQRLLHALDCDRPSSVLVSGATGVGKSHMCEAVFVRTGIEVIRWDPIATGMRVPALVGSTASRIVLYVDDVDLAIHGGPKGSASAMIAAIRAIRAPATRCLLMVMTSGNTAGDRTLTLLAKTVDVHLQLVPSRDEVLSVLLGCVTLADRYGTDIRAAMIAATNVPHGGAVDSNNDEMRIAVPNMPKVSAKRVSRVLREAEATLLQSSGIGSDAACSDDLVWIAEEYRKNFSRCV